MDGTQRASKATENERQGAKDAKALTHGVLGISAVVFGCMTGGRVGSVSTLSSGHTGQIWHSCISKNCEGTTIGSRAVPQGRDRAGSSSLQRPRSMAPSYGSPEPFRVPVP